MTMTVVPRRSNEVRCTRVSEGEVWLFFSPMNWYLNWYSSAATAFTSNSLSREQGRNWHLMRKQGKSLFYLVNIQLLWYVTVCIWLSPGSNKLPLDVRMFCTLQPFLVLHPLARRLTIGALRCSSRVRTNCELSGALAIFRLCTFTRLCINTNNVYLATFCARLLTYRACNVSWNSWSFLYFAFRRCLPFCSRMLAY